MKFIRESFRAYRMSRKAKRKLRQIDRAFDSLILIASVLKREAISETGVRRFMNYRARLFRITLFWPPFVDPVRFHYRVAAYAARMENPRP